MAMYYQGSSDIQADGLHTLYLMNPNYLSSYSDPHPNTPFFNPAIAPPPPQQFMDISSDDPSHPSPSHEIAIPRFGHHHLWGSVDHHRHQFACGNSNQPNTPQQQTPKGLSLSLAPGFSKSIHDNPTGDDQNFRGKIISPEIDEVDGNNDNNNNSVGSVIMGSKYLKAVRELLDEVVSVGRETRSDGPEGAKDKAKMVKESIRAKVGESSEEYGTKNGGDELTTTQRLEIQMKKAKLSNMLDEVEQRYKQYHHQMQTIVTSFDQVAGAGSAKSYTHLALKTILKQFRCLKNTISSQIKALNTTLGEDENTKGSKLKFVDHHFRQQRALQQLGTMQNNNVAWRQQRGLPEKAVSVLRAWLFEHFLHPYPKESDKHMLAKQTGLTKSQVSNWFINARVRLWKPMVEEMYLEEVKNQEINPDDNTIKFESRIGIESRKTLINSKSNLSQQASNIPKTPIIKNLNTLQSMQNNKPTLNLVTSSSHISASTIITKSTTRNIENPLEKNPKKRRNKNQDNSPSSILSVDIETKPGEYHTSNGFNNNITFINMNSEHTRENYLSSSGFSNTYGILSTGELPNRFNNNVDDDRQQIPFGFQRNNSNFSLTLALPPSETYSQGAHQRDFLSQGSFEFGTRIEPVGSNNRPNIGNYDQILDFQNRKSFSTQILPGHHFVA